MKIIQRTVFVAEDGTEFGSEEACLNYESPEDIDHRFSDDKFNTETIYYSIVCRNNQHKIRQLKFIRYSEDCFRYMNEEKNTRMIYNFAEFVLVNSNDTHNVSSTSELFFNKVTSDVFDLIEIPKDELRRLIDEIHD